MTAASAPVSWNSISLVNAPFGFLLSSLYGPCSATCPLEESTMMVSERFMVERRCAIEMVVLLPRKSAERAELTRVSDSASKAEVAIDERLSTQFEIERVEIVCKPSSRIKISGFLTKARAMAIRCFCPPDNCVPRAPTEVSRPSGRVPINC